MDKIRICLPARFSQGRGVRLLGFLLIPVLFVLTSCRQKSAVEEANARGWFLWENGAEPQTIDPQLSTSKGTSYILNALFEGLVIADPETSRATNMGVARSWDISPDKTVYTFHFRPDAKWSNGVPVTAHDFHYSYKRMLSKGLASKYSYMLFPIKNGEAYYNGDITDFAEVGVKVLDDLTLEITLERATPYILDLMTHGSWLPVYPPAVEEHGGMLDLNNKWTRPENIIGNGAFKMKEWIPNTHLDVERRDDHWDAENTRLNGVRFYPIENRETAQRAFRREAIHCTYTIPPHRVIWGKKNQPENVNITPALGVYFYRVNISEPSDSDSPESKAVKEAMRKKKVRQALSYAINREAICQFLKAGQRPATGFVPPGAGSYEAPQILTFDPEKAQQLLAEAGYPEGQGFPEFELMYNTDESHKQVAEIIQEQWKTTLGINITLANQEWKVFLSTLHEMNYQMARSAWFADYIDPKSFLDMWITDGGNNETGFSSAKYDQLIKDADLAGREPERRLQIYQEAETLLLDELPIIPIYFYVSQHMVHPSVIDWKQNIMDDQFLRFMDVKRP